jgi:hypothetical protein
MTGNSSQVPIMLMPVVPPPEMPLLQKASVEVRASSRNGGDGRAVPCYSGVLKYRSSRAKTMSVRIANSATSTAP